MNDGASGLECGRISAGSSQNVLCKNAGLGQHVRSDAGNIPEWFRVLQERGLFVRGPEADGLQFYQKLSSYALAYWALEVAYRTIEIFVDALPDGASLCGYLVHNFGLYRLHVCHPAKLRRYDKRYGLELTVSERERTHSG